MESNVESRSARKRRVIVEAATKVFLDKGYDRSSMDDVATMAAVSKPTVYSTSTTRRGSSLRSSARPRITLMTSCVW